MKLAFGDLLPDLPAYGSPGVAEAVNLYPTSVGYRPVGQWVSHSDALPTACRGASAFIAPSGRLSIIACTATTIYRLNGLAWTSLATGYTTTATGRWRFAQFGGFAVATNATDNMVKINLETDAVTTLGGTPPKFQALAVVNNFLVGTQVNGNVNQVAWSGENDAEWWTFAQRKSDYNPFADGGEITGIIGGEVGLILQRNAVRRMAYVGGNLLFRFDKISSNIGCDSIHSVVQHGELAAWYSSSGFKMWDGATIRSIGFEKIDRAFSSLYGEVDLNSMSTSVDGQRNTFCWSTGSKMWLFNWLLDKWSVIDYAAEIITPRESRAPNLEVQDAIVGALDDNADGSPLISFDSGRFVGGDPVFYVFSGGALGTFNGLNMAAKIVGRDTEMKEGRDVYVRRVRPMTDATGGLSLRLDARQRLGDAARTRDFATLMSSGEMNTRQRGRFIRAQLTIAADQSWTYLEGLDATISKGGRR